MNIVVVANDELQRELLAQGLQADTAIEWTKTVPPETAAEYIIDLLFDNDPARVESLQKLQVKMIIVNAVTTTLDVLAENFIRINGWPGFLQRTIIEAAGNDTLKKEAEEVFLRFNKTTEWVPDKAGFISATIISMIINEAFFAVGEQVSSKEDIDTAMKLGTNYPFGPFEWSKKIGVRNIHDLLTILSKKNSRYQPADLLYKETLSS